MADGKIVIQIDGDSGALKKDVDGLGSAVSGKLGEIGKSIQGSIGSALSGLASGALSALNQLTGWNGFQSIVTDALDVGMAFENSMSNVASLQKAAGATEAQIASLKDAAEQFGATTQFTMAECADALGFMALAGWDAEKSISALPGVLNLSAASGMGLAQASDMVTDYMSAFSKSVSDYTGEALTAAEFSDKLAFAQANSNTNVQMLGDAFKNCAANMNASGQQMDTVVSILGALANQGLKGSEAGTALSAVMRDINNEMEDGAISINGTTIAIADANGNYRDMIDIMADIEKATAGMGDTQKAAALSAVFTADSIKGMNLVLNAGTDSIRDFESKLSHCEGSAEEMAKVLNDNLEGDTKALGSAMDAVKNALYEGLEPAFRGIVQTITNNVAPALLDITKSFFDMMNGIPEAGTKLKSSLGNLWKWLTDTIKNYVPKLLKNAVSGITKSMPTVISAVTTVVNSIFDIVKSLDLISLVKEGIKNVTDRISNSNVIFREAVVAMISGISGAMPDILQGAVEIVQMLCDGIRQNFDSNMRTGRMILETLVDGIIQTLPILLECAGTIISTLVDTIIPLLPQIIDAGFQILEKLVAGILDNLPQLLDGAVKIVNYLTENILTGDNLQKLLKAGSDILEKLKNAIIDNIDDILLAAETIITKLCDELFTEENVTILIGSGSDMLGKIIDGLCQVSGRFAGFAWSLFTELAEELAHIDWKQLGTKIEEAIISGLMGVDFTYEDFRRGLWDNWKDGMQQIFGEGSTGGASDNGVSGGSRRREGRFEDYNAMFQEAFPNFSAVSNQLQSASLMAGASALPMSTNNYTTHNNNNQTTAQNGDIIIPIYLEGEQIQTAVLSAIQIENMRSGGGFV